MPYKPKFISFLSLRSMVGNNCNSINKYMRDKRKKNGKDKIPREYQEIKAQTLNNYSNEVMGYSFQKTVPLCA